MKNYRKIINIILLLTVSSIFVGCAQKITEEQALAEEQAIVEMIQSYSHVVANPRATNVLSRMKSRNPNKRLVLLSGSLGKIVWYTSSLHPIEIVKNK